MTSQSDVLITARSPGCQISVANRERAVKTELELTEIQQLIVWTPSLN